jgi:PAS domain-containing protein
VIDAEDQKLIASGQTTFLDEHAVLTPDNGTRIVTATRLLVKETDGKPQYLIAVINDLTERKRHEQRIEPCATEGAARHAEFSYQR